MKSYIKRIFSLDYRSIAALRIIIGLTLLFDVIQRSTSLIAHYTDIGLLPRSELFRIDNYNGYWSLHFINGSPLFISILFIIAGVFALMMIVGYKTRISTIVSFIMLISIHNRNPMVLQGGDVALRVILFWMIFMPLSNRFSLDNILNKTKNLVEDKNYFAIPGIIYSLQFISIYLFAGFMKDGAPWVSTYNAVGLTLALDQFTTYFGVWLKSMPKILPAITIFTLWLERYLFVFFIFPFKNSWARLIGVFLAAILMIGINLSLKLGLFGMIMVAISIGLLPGVFWDKIINPIRFCFINKSKTNFTIFYDFECGFCYKMVHVIKTLFLLHPGTVILPASSNPQIQDLMDQKNSWVVKDPEGNLYTGFSAFICILRSSFLFRIFTPFLRIKPISFIGEKIYHLVANNRALTCNTHVVNSQYKTDIYLKTLRNSFLIILFGTITVWNIHYLPKYTKMKVHPVLEKILFVIRLDQKWGMFAPYPTTNDGFYVIPGILADRSNVDVYTGSHIISYDKPQHMSDTYKNQRWQKYLMNIWDDTYKEYRLGYGRYLCRTWDEQHYKEQELMKFSIVYILENTDINTLEEQPLEQLVIWEHNCLG
jgi:predicted DCC family thiol-disulfide oxidoreductase YuxK